MAQSIGATRRRAALTLAALGVVYGDIGTSPLYAVKEALSPERGIGLAAANVIGGISAIFWALMIVVSLKYVILIMRADNRGEGGIVALLALASASVHAKAKQWAGPLLLIGLFGAALFYGDAVLTPSISVLSAIEGLEVGDAGLKRYVLPIATGVLLGLFILQRKGTGTIGKLFGPICVLWFLALGTIGAYQVARQPVILRALDPWHAVLFVTTHGVASFLVLGSVLLAFTGAEALYADMGHFGRGPVRIAWFGLVFPALILNYLGQGALLIASPQAIANPFYRMYPAWALFPMVGLATAATVIASQATITGTYSLTSQAIQLGFLPRMRMLHTSAKEIGQIYLPAANWAMLAGVMLAVLGFGSSARLASAYGVAVSGTMVVTTALTFFVIRYAWGYSLPLCIAATGFLAVVDVAFFSSSLLKVADGGWFPLVLGTGIYVIMLTWRRGRELLMARLRGGSIPLEPFLATLFVEPPHRVPGTAVFLTPTPDLAPAALLHNLKHNKVLHERVLFVSVAVRDEPWVPFDQRVSVEPLGRGFWRVLVHYGFMNRPDLPQALELCKTLDLSIEPMETSFFLSRETVIPASSQAARGLAPWRRRLFATMQRNAGTAAEYFNIPSNRVIELGAQVEL